MSFEEIDSFQGFGFVHILTLISVTIIFVVWMYFGKRAENENQRFRIRVFLALFIVLVRFVRYVMDIVYGRFEISDLFSLHICHIDLILLVICLIKPNKFIFSFNFMLGIPLGLAVALFPGNSHPVPGLLRAIFFISSHMMLVGGAVYLWLVEGLKVSFKNFLIIAVSGLIGVGIIYKINTILGSNFLYLIEAPEGTVIYRMANIFGYPGYVFVMIGIALLCMFLFYIISNIKRISVNAGAIC